MDETTLMRPDQLLVAVIGNRDIQIPDGSPYAQAWHHGPRSARHAGRLLLDALAGATDAAALTTFDLPLLRPLVRRLTDAGERPGTILLVATDQPEATGEEHRASDTIHFATLIERHLRVVEGFPPAAIEIAVFTGDPSDYAETFPFLRQCFASLRARHDPAAGTICHLAPTGGTPAATAALLVEGIAAYGSAARVLYVPRGAETPRDVPIVQDLQARTLRRALHDTIQAYAYAAAAKLCATDASAFATLLPPGDPRQALFLALLRHGSQRLNANLDDARAILAAHDAALRQLLPAQAPRLALPTPTNERERDAQTIREVIASAEVMFRLAHYFDFIARVGTFMDTYGKYVAQHIFGARPTVLPGGRGKITLAPWIKQQPDLHAYLVTEKEVKIEGPPTQHLYKMIVAFAVKSDPARRPLHKAVSDKRLADLSELRNATVHRYDEITRDRLWQEWKDDPATIVAGLRELANLAGIDGVADNPFDALQEGLLTLLA